MPRWSSGPAQIRMDSVRSHTSSRAPEASKGNCFPNVRLSTGPGASRRLCFFFCLWWLRSAVAWPVVACFFRASDGRSVVDVSLSLAHLCQTRLTPQYGPITVAQWQVLPRAAICFNGCRHRAPCKGNGELCMMNLAVLALPYGCPLFSVARSTPTCCVRSWLLVLVNSQCCISLTVLCFLTWPRLRRPHQWECTPTITNTDSCRWVQFIVLPHFAGSPGVSSLCSFRSFSSTLLLDVGSEVRNRRLPAHCRRHWRLTTSDEDSHVFRKCLVVMLDLVLCGTSLHGSCSRAVLQVSWLFQQISERRCLSWLWPMV